MKKNTDHNYQDAFPGFLQKPHACAMCDCHHDEQDSYFSLAGAGPFCSECWESLTDADQALLLDKHLAAAEQKIEELQAEITRLQSGGSGQKNHVDAV